MAYESILYEYEYLDASRKGFGIPGLLQLFEDVAEDTFLKQLDASYNMNADDVIDNRDIEFFFKKMKFNLSKNKSLTALDMAGNHLFDHFPHPSNEHTKNYVIELANILGSNSKITHIDLSENNIAGARSRELKGLHYFMVEYMMHGHAFQCRLSGLNSQCFKTISACLGPFSNMTYLDLSDNMGGLDPSGVRNGEGVAAIAMNLGHSLHMRVLKLARNFLVDDDISCIANVLHNMPQFQDLDLSGNLCHSSGAKSLNLTFISHSVLTQPGMGFRHVNLSHNPLGDKGVVELCRAIEKTITIISLGLASCHIENKGMERLQQALVHNGSILNFDVSDNKCSKSTEIRTTAEIEANHLVDLLATHPDAVDANQLSEPVYLALSRKLCFLQKPQLAALHGNPTFNVDLSEMKLQLHLLEPPPREALILKVKHVDTKLQQRLKESRQLDKKLVAARVVFAFMMSKYSDFLLKRQVQLLLAEAKRKEEEANVRNDEDDRYLIKNK